MIAVEDALAEHAEAIAESLDIPALADQFKREGIVRAREFVPATIVEAVRDEADSLLACHGQRRDIRLPTTNYSPRAMKVVPSELIADFGDVIGRTYSSACLRRLLEKIAGERLNPCPSKDEEFLIARHERTGDTHGWHWGDFSFALIWVLTAPPIGRGGLVQCVPGTSWNKADARINELLCENPIHTYYFESGELYLLRTDTTLHRTIPLEADATRTMLNMTWASNADLDRPLVGDDRWWSLSGVDSERDHD